MKRTFKVNIDGKDVEFSVKSPNNKQQQEGQNHYNRAFRLAVNPTDGKPGCIVRAKLESILREQNLWNDEKAKQYVETVNRLLENEKILTKKGGIKKSEARRIAIEMRKDRNKINELSSERNQLDLTTAEAQAEQARFNYFVSVCTVYNDTGNQYFKDLEDYETREDDPVSFEASVNFGKIWYNLDDDFQKKLPENRFLLEYKFCDEKLRLTNKDGKLVDEWNRLINEDGRLINEKGELIDSEGNLLTDSGDYKADEFVPFLDDEPEKETTPSPANSDS